MKRFSILSLVLTICLIYKSNAQLLKSYGAKLAVTSATQQWDYLNVPVSLRGPDLKRRTGIGAAVFVEWLNIPILSVITQVEYIQRGFTQDFESSFGNIRTDTRNNRLDYLSVPILVKASSSMTMISPYIFAGPRFDILLGYRDSFFNPSAIDEQLKKASIGGSVGLGLELHRFLPVSVLAEFRYNIDAMKSYYTNSIRMSNNAYDFWLGVAF